MHVFCKERFEDPKRGIGSRQSKDRQYNEQMKKHKNTNTDPLDTIQQFGIWWNYIASLTKSWRNE